MEKISLKYIGHHIKSGPRIGVKSFLAQEYFKSHIIIWLLILSLVVNVINWAILKLWVKPVEYPIILHYNVYFGVDLMGDYGQVYVLPIIGLVLLAINLNLSMYFYGQKERIASYIIMMASLMIQLSLIVASASVILINY